MTDLRPPPDSPADERRPAPRPAALRVLHWLFPSILVAFAVPGFLVMRAGAGASQLVLTAQALEALRMLGPLSFFIVTVLRAWLWPPRGLQALVRRLSS